jgi:hypothetical protein
MWSASLRCGAAGVAEDEEPGEGIVEGGVTDLKSGPSRHLWRKPSKQSIGDAGADDPGPPRCDLAATRAVTLTRSEADRSGADLIGTGIPLASALQKLERGAAIVPMDVEPARSSAYIVNPLTGRSVSFAGLFSTHPPTQQSIAALIDEDRTLSRQR